MASPTIKCEECGKVVDKRGYTLHKLIHDEEFVKKRAERLKKSREDRKGTGRNSSAYTIYVEKKMLEKARKLRKNEGSTIQYHMQRLLAERFLGHDLNEIKKIKRENVYKLKCFLDSQKTDGGFVPCQFVGIPGAGKSFLMKDVIKRYNGPKGKCKFIVFDTLSGTTDVPSGYEFLPSTTVIPEPDQITTSLRITPNISLVARDMIFEANYTSKLLSHVWPKDVIFVLEEAHRFKDNAELLMKEMRKHGRLIVISPTPIIEEFPYIRMIN